MTKELLQQALEALEEMRWDVVPPQVTKAITALKTAIAQPVQPTQTALDKLLSVLDAKAGSGFIPWEIEDAFADYIAAQKEK